MVQLLPPLDRLRSREVGLMIAVVLSASMMWMLHFVLEFSVLMRLGLPLWLITFHLGGVSIGAIFFLVWSSKQDLFRVYLGFLIIQTIVLVLLILFPYSIFSQDFNFWLVSIFLGIAGFTIGTSACFLYPVSSIFLQDRQYNGRYNALGYLMVAPITMIAAYIDSTGNYMLLALFLCVICALSAICFLIGRSGLEKVPPREMSVSSYIRKREMYGVFLLIFFIGFFFTNSYYAAVIILGETAITLNSFVMVLYLGAFISFIPSGLLIDKLGRRYSTLIGFYIQALAFMLLSFSVDDFTLGIVFPILIGIGFTLSVWGSVVHIYELTPKGYLTIQQGVIFTLFGIGMVIGVLTDTVLESLILLNPVYLPLTLIFAFLTATIVVLQVQETLPSSEELEWRSKVEHLLVLSIGGLPIYSERLSKSLAPSMGPDEMLVGGALSGISDLVREISRSATDLKVIQQEGYCIILEDGGTFLVAIMATEDLKAIRIRMQDFRDDFKRVFGQLIDEWAGNPKVFSPAKELVAQHFG